MSFFGSNPFTTPVGLKIEQATSDTLPTEDWGLNLEICDLINSSEDAAKDAVRAIRKRLTSSPKNHKTVLFTLVALETCVKNTGHKFHVLVCSKDFVQDLVKLIGPKNEPPTSVQDKVLSLIQSWTEAFRHQPEMSGVSQVYAELKHKGVDFPPPDSDATPIITPTRENSGASMPRPAPVGGAAPRPPPTTAPPLSRPPTASPPPSQPPTSHQSQGLSGDVRSKLSKELTVVESNAAVLAEMLSGVTAGQEHADDLQLMQELHAACQAMQQRVVGLVARVSDDLLTADLLMVNDTLNNLFIRYDRHMSKSRAMGSPVKTVEGAHRPPVPPPVATPPPPSVEEVSLIDLGDDAPPPTAVESQAPVQQLQQLDITSPKKVEDVDFDSFAQSRTSVLDTGKRETTGAETAGAGRTGAAAGEEGEQVASNFDSMERWMSSQPYGSEISSDAFQKFLSDRATAADRLPTIAASTGSTAPPPPSAGPADA